MKTLALVLTIVLAPLGLAFAQEAAATEGTVIESAELSGLPLDQLSPGLRQDITGLAGQPLNRERLGTLADRIESEHPDVVAAVRDVLRADGRVRVVFLVARISDDEKLSSNINARYTVGRVRFEGLPESRISQSIRDDARTMVGRMFDPDLARQIVERLTAELPDYVVRRRMSRGGASSEIEVTFDIRRSEASRWVPWAPSPSKVVYHSDQGWTFDFDGSTNGSGSGRFGLGLVFGNQDDLLEEYSGFSLRFENREVGTRRLGVGLEFWRYTNEWQERTVAALPLHSEVPPLYDVHLGVQPTVTFAFDPHLRISGGVSVSELELLAPWSGSQMASAGLGRIGYDRTWRGANNSRQFVEAGYEFRAGSSALDSDLIYERHVGHARYEFEQRHNVFLASFIAGRVTGRAPLFERFTLGNSTTLRGFDKFDLAPAGATRMFHQSLEYRYRSFAYFLDMGSLWDEGLDANLRVSTGIGVHTRHFSMSVGVPLDADDAGVTFIMGIRF